MPRIFKAANVIEEPKTIIHTGVNEVVEEIQDLPQAQSIQQEVHPVKEVFPTEQVEAILAEARQEAQEILQIAREEANEMQEKMRREAQKQISLEEERSRKEGYDAGYQEGVQQAEILKQQAETLLSEAQGQKENALHSLEDEVLDLVFAIVDKLLNSTIQLNPQLILVLLRQGLNESTVTGDIHIKVSAADYEEVMKEKDVIFSMIDNATNIEILKDLSLEQSDCVIETPFGNIDCSLMEQYKLLKETMYHILQGTKKKEAE